MKIYFQHFQEFFKSFWYWSLIASTLLIPIIRLYGKRLTALPKKIRNYHALRRLKLFCGRFMRYCKGEKGKPIRARLYNFRYTWKKHWPTWKKRIDGIAKRNKKELMALNALLIVIVIGISIPAFGALHRTLNDPKFCIGKAQKFVDKSNYSNAHKWFDKALILPGSDKAQIHFDKAKTYRYSNDNESALLQADLAISEIIQFNFNTLVEYYEQLERYSHIMLTYESKARLEVSDENDYELALKMISDQKYHDAKEKILYYQTEISKIKTEASDYGLYFDLLVFKGTIHLVLSDPFTRGDSSAYACLKEAILTNAQSAPINALLGYACSNEIEAMSYYALAIDYGIEKWLDIGTLTFFDIGNLYSNPKEADMFMTAQSILEMYKEDGHEFLHDRHHIFTFKNQAMEEPKLVNHRVVTAQKPDRYSEALYWYSKAIESKELDYKAIKSNKEDRKEKPYDLGFMPCIPSSSIYAQKMTTHLRRYCSFEELSELKNARDAIYSAFEQGLVRDGFYHEPAENTYPVLLAVLEQAIDEVEPLVNSSEDDYEKRIWSNIWGLAGDLVSAYNSAFTINPTDLESAIELRNEFDLAFGYYEKANEISGNVEGSFWFVKEFMLNLFLMTLDMTENKALAVHSFASYIQTMRQMDPDGMDASNGVFDFHLKIAELLSATK